MCVTLEFDWGGRGRVTCPEVGAAKAAWWAVFDPLPGVRLPGGRPRAPAYIFELK